MTHNPRQVYLLDPQKLPPETIAVAFAKTSRSPQSFREIAAELTDEKSAEFHERWVVGYGHASVAEHAVLHIAVENISRLAVEVLESNRLASYTEKSTRYQTWTPDGYYIPEELTAPPLRKTYADVCRLLFDTYQRALPAVREVILRENPPQPGESEAAWDRRLRSAYVDVCRFLLPAASLANVGVTINARALEHALRKMISHPLAEVRAAGEEMKAVAQAQAPTLVKYADAQPYLQRLPEFFSEAAAEIPTPDSPPADWCTLISSDPDGENRVLAAALYRFGQHSYPQILAHLRSLNAKGRRELAHLLLDGLERHDIPLRELEYCSYTVDLTLDQGAYFELKRHRMMTQTAQPLSPYLGYAVPRRIRTAGIEEDYRRAMQAAAQAYEHLAAWNPQVASYVIPNAFNRRVLLQFNLRSAFHLVNLRTAENAHFSIRRAVLRIAEQIQAAHPLLGAYLRLPAGETWKTVEDAHFVQTA